MINLNDPIHIKSALAEVMAWYQQASGHYLE